jgi:hypothetical protein
MKNILNAIVDDMAEMAIHITALEAALIQRGSLTTAEVDGIRSLKALVANQRVDALRGLISQLP